MPALPERTDLEVVFGKANIALWGDADNTEDAGDIDARITWAIDQAYNYVAGRLAKRFKVADWTALPSLVFNLVAMRGGIELYQHPRGLVDGDTANNAINSINLKVESQIDQILAGQLHLLDHEGPKQQIAVDNSTALPNHDYRMSQLEGAPIPFPYGRFFQTVQ